MADEVTLIVCRACFACGLDHFDIYTHIADFALIAFKLSLQGFTILAGREVRRVTVDSGEDLLFRQAVSRRNKGKNEAKDALVFRDACSHDHLFSG
jgi:hypothetical protein